MIERTKEPVRKLALFVALWGGFVLVALAILTGISIVGRAFLWAGLKPVPGDVELMESGVAFAVCAFLPWCQLQRGHASVAILTDRWNQSINALIDLVVDLLLTGVAALLLWRHVEGLQDKFNFGETSFILQFPIWWPYTAMLLGLTAWIVVGLWAVFADFAALKDGKRRIIDLEPTQ